MGTLLLGRVCIGDGRSLVERGAILVEDHGIAHVDPGPDLAATTHEAIDNGQQTQPRGYPVGIDAVIVSGAFAVEGGRLTDELNGTPLRKG